MGSRADRADDRAAHGRGGLRGRRRRARRRRREAARRARRPALPGRTSSRCCSPSAAPATSRRWRAAVTRQARRAPSARLRRRRGATPPARVRENWERLKVEQEGARGRLPRRSARRCRRCCSRARCSGARPRSASTTPTSRARSPTSTTSCASCGPSCRRRPSPRGARSAVAAELGDVLFAVRERRADARTSIPSSSCAPRPERFRARVEEAERLAAADGENWRELPLDAAGPLLRPGEGVGSMSRIADVHGRQVLDSRGNPTVEVEVPPRVAARSGRGDRALGRLDRRPRGGRAARRRRGVGRQGRDSGGRERQRRARATPSSGLDAQRPGGARPRR